MLPAEAPAAAAVLERARGENFPVTSLLFPAALRPHLMAVYGFARLVDDLGDEASGDRLALLDWLSGELDLVFGGGTPSHPLLRRLARSVRALDLPRGPFDRLVAANRWDQVVNRYASFEELAEYCSMSATPVGELVLRICGAATPDRLALSDAVCTGLQLVEFWQDLGEDAARGRVYLPLEDLERFGYSVEDLLAGRTGQPFLRLMRFEVQRTRALLERGRPLARSLPGRVGLAVRLFTAGGLAALADLERRGFDTLRRNASPSRPRRWWYALKELAR
ncbi:MAG TPA: squalene synthase HpnC [Actinomycetota bacterium]|nr:squalene synthase HpnC [Actinomycetota bacterium]